CEYVVERVRGLNRPEVAGIVDERREEVECEDERRLVVEPVDGGVVGGREPYEQVLRLGRHEAGQQLLEPRRRVFRCAAAGRDELCQLDGHDVNRRGCPRTGTVPSERSVGAVPERGLSLL